MLLPLDLPATPEGWLEFLSARCDQQLETARRTIELIGRTRHDPRRTLARWNSVTLSVLNATAAATLIRQAHPDADLRDCAEQAEQEVTAFGFALRQDRSLYKALQAVDTDIPDPAAARMRAMSLREFRRAGVDLDEEQRRELRELGERCTVLAQEFERNLTSDVRSVALRPERLEGLPEDFVATHQPGPGGTVAISTEYPDALPFLSFAHDADARLKVATAFDNRGWPDNDAVLRELFELRARGQQGLQIKHIWCLFRGVLSRPASVKRRYPLAPPLAGCFQPRTAPSSESLSIGGTPCPPTTLLPST